VKSPILMALAICVAAARAQDDRIAVARKLSGAGQHAQAISEYRKALEKAPNSSQIWLELAETRMSAGQFQAASGDFSRAVRLEPTNLRAQRGLATAVEKSGNLQRALLEWRRASQLAQGPEQAEAEANVDRLMALVGQAPAPKNVDTARSAPQGDHKPPPSSTPAKVKSEDSDPADVKKAVASWKAGQRDKALEMLRGIIKKSPSTEAYYYAGLMRLEEKKLDMAEFNLKQAVSDKELGAAAWYWLGRTQEARKKPAEAKASFHKSLALDSKGEFAAEAKARIQPEPKKNVHDTTRPAAAPKEMVKPEAAPPMLPDTLRSLYSCTPPSLKIPSGDGSAAGKLLDEASKQMAARQNDLALSSLEQIKLKESASPIANLVGLASAVVYEAMGIHPNALGQVEGFLKDHPKHPFADYAKFVAGISLLRSGKPDSAATLLGPLPIATKGSMWTEADRQSALGEALRLSGKPADALAALRLAFQAETDVRSRRSIALRMSREAAKARTPDQALVALTQSRKACDKSPACLQVEVTEADLLWGSGKHQDAAGLYSEIARNWPNSTEAPWAMYQSGNAFQKQGKSDLAASTWKSLIERHPESYWAGQARLRLEDAVWRTRYKGSK